MSVLVPLVAVALGLAAGWSLRGSRSANRSYTAHPETHMVSPDPADLIEELPTGVIVSDRDGQIRYRNLSARSMAEPHARALIDDAIKRHLARGRVGLESEEMIELHGPPTTTIVVQARPLSDGGSVVYVDDISETRRIDQVRTDFVANISHELKTPIGALSVLAEALVDETDHEIITRVVGRMMTEASRAVRTIDDLMELSTIELAAERLVEPVEIAGVVQGAVDRVAEVATYRGISVVVVDPLTGVSNEPPMVDGDRRQLISALGNLVENAVKYSEPGDSVTIGVASKGDWFEILVADQGVGIPQRDLDRIFERFYRVDPARSRDTGGTGLGLSIVRHVANQHMGEVLVSSSEGEGSTFTLRLPHSNGATVAETHMVGEGEMA